MKTPSRISAIALLTCILLTTSFSTQADGVDTKNTWSNLHQKDLLKQAGVETAQVVLTFTVDNSRHIQVINASSNQETVKALVLEQLSGSIADEAYLPGSVYMVTFNFKRL